jgi:hypothetical protein
MLAIFPFTTGVSQRSRLTAVLESDLAIQSTAVELLKVFRFTMGVSLQLEVRSKVLESDLAMIPRATMEVSDIFPFTTALSQQRD